MVLAPKPTRFNIRVYGILLHEGKILVNEEEIQGKRVVKFPGGGLELGEGIQDCLCREWMEELGLKIEVGNHIYTTDFFQPSAFDNSQVISVYYYVHCSSLPATIINYIPAEHTYWLAIEALDASLFTLPIDKIVAAKLAIELNS